MPLNLTDDQVNIGSGNGLVRSGNKPLPEPMFNPDLYRQMASLGLNELNTHMNF